MVGFVFAHDAEEKKEPVTISKALELGEEGLTQYTGLSEVGQDEAAEFYATAKRLTTEQALGQKKIGSWMRADQFPEFAFGTRLDQGCDRLR